MEHAGSRAVIHRRAARDVGQKIADALSAPVKAEWKNNRGHRLRWANGLRDPNL